MQNFIQPIKSDLLVDLFVGRPQPKYNWMQRAFLAILFIGGVCLWGQALNWGRGPLTIHDWANISGPRLAFLREALIRRELPLHSSVLPTDGGLTLRYLAIPDQILSPQIFLLPWLDEGRFVLVQYWFMYALGFWALLHLRRRFELSILAFTILFALYNFNGHILAHASVGHANWGGYFLYAGFALLIFDLLDGKTNWRWVAKVVFWSLFIFLQGSYHHFVWVLFFLGLLVLIVPRHFRWLAAAAVFTVLVSMARILPAALLLGQTEDRFLAGYPLVQSIWQYLTQLQVPNDLTTTLGLTGSIGTWEYTFFIGLPAAVFVLYFGVICPLLNREDPYHFRVLLLPCLGLTLLSLDKVYSTLLKIIPFPLLTGERVAARFFSLAFVFILIGSVVYFQRWLEKNRIHFTAVVAMLLLVALVANDLQRNLFLWSVLNVGGYFPIDEFVPALYYPVNQYDDTRYQLFLSIGLLVSLVSAALLLFLAWRERHLLSKSHPKS